MLKIKNMTNDNNCTGVAIIFLWIISVSVVHSIERGDHIHIGFGLGPLEASMGFHLWRKLLP